MWEVLGGRLGFFFFGRFIIFKGRVWISLLDVNKYFWSVWNMLVLCWVLRISDKRGIVFILEKFFGRKRRSKRMMLLCKLCGREEFGGFENIKEGV